MEKERKKIKLVDICEISKGSQLNRTDMVDDGKYYVQNGGIDISGYTNEYNTEENTISISEGGNSCGYVNYNKEKFWAGGHCYRLINIVDGVYVKYLYHVLKYKQNDIMNLRVGSGLPNIQKKDIEKLKFYLPDFKIQKRIGDLLDLVDEIIEKYDVLLQEYQQLVKSQFVEMFGNPLSVKKKFPEIELIKVVKLQRGYDLPNQARDRKGVIPVYGANGILDKHIISKSSNGIITGRSGTIGKVYYTYEKFWPLNTTLFSIETYGNNIIYLKHLLDMFDLKRFVDATGVPTLNRNIVHKQKIINAPIELQNQFADFVKQIDKLKFELEKQKENYVNLKKGLMQQLLTGKIEINI